MEYGKWQVRDVRLGEDADAIYTAATKHETSTVYRIDKRTRRRKVLGTRDRLDLTAIEGFTPEVRADD